MRTPVITWVYPPTTVPSSHSEYKGNKSTNNFLGASSAGNPRCIVSHSHQNCCRKNYRRFHRPPLLRCSTPCQIVFGYTARLQPHQRRYRRRGLYGPNWRPRIRPTEEQQETSVKISGDARQTLSVSPTAMGGGYFRQPYPTRLKSG